MSLLELREAGRRLAEALSALREDDPVLLAVPRRGAIIGHQVARSLHLPLDVLMVRKIGAPCRERPVGAVVLSETRLIEESAAAALHMSPAELERLFDREARLLVSRAGDIRGDVPLPEVTGRLVVVIDDAIISGLTMRAAATWARGRQARRVVAATALCSTAATDRIRPAVDDLVALECIDLAAAAARHEAAALAICPPLADPEIAQLVADTARRPAPSSAPAGPPPGLPGPAPAAHP